MGKARVELFRIDKPEEKAAKLDLSGLASRLKKLGGLEPSASSSRPPAFSPAIDTVHLAVPMPSEWLDAFFHDTAERGSCYLVRKEESGKLEVEKTLLHTRYLRSWWSSMVFLRKSVPHHGECLWINYSYHKWHMVTNAFNCALPCDFASVFEPVAQALRSFRVSEEELEGMADRAVLRRVDWSVNFKVEGVKVSDILKTMFRFKVQYQDSPSVFGKDWETLMWGTKNSAFQIKCYDKEKEVRKHFTGSDATSKEKDFYFSHFEELKDIMRFEVGFSSRWWISDDLCEKRGLRKVWKAGYEMKGTREKAYGYDDARRQAVGPAQIGKVLRLSKEKMRELHARVFAQFETQGNSFDDAFDFYAVQEAIKESEFKTSLKHSLCFVVSEFWIKCYEEAKKEFKEQTFYRYKKILLERFNWDIRVKSSMNTGVMSLLARQTRQVRYVVDGSIISARQIVREKQKENDMFSS